MVTRTVRISVKDFSLHQLPPLATVSGATPQITSRININSFSCSFMYTSLKDLMSYNISFIVTWGLGYLCNISCHTSCNDLISSCIASTTTCTFDFCEVTAVPTTTPSPFALYAVQPFSNKAIKVRGLSAALMKRRVRIRFGVLIEGLHNFLDECLQLL